MKYWTTKRIFWVSFGATLMLSTIMWANLDMPGIGVPCLFIGETIFLLSFIQGPGNFNHPIE